MWRRRTRSPDPDSQGPQHAQGGMEGHEKQDPDFVQQDHYKNEMKEENQDSDFLDKEYYKGVIKEENQDPDFTDQGPEFKTEEENQDPDLTDHSVNGIQEESRDPEPPVLGTWVPGLGLDPAHSAGMDASMDAYYLSGSYTKTVPKHISVCLISVGRLVTSQTVEEQ